MKINKLDFIRVLNIVKSVGQNEVKFDEKGVFGVQSPDGNSLVFGKGVEFGRPLNLVDVDRLIKMLNSFVDADVNISFDDKESRMVLAGSKLMFGYKLAKAEYVEGLEQSKKEEYLKSGKWASRKLKIEELMEIKRLVKSLNEDDISFCAEGGNSTVMVGDKKLFYGEIAIADLGLDRNRKFKISRVLPVLDSLDENEVDFGFLLTKKCIMKIEQKDFVWFLGGEVSVK